LVAGAVAVALTGCGGAGSSAARLFGGAAREAGAASRAAHEVGAASRVAREAEAVAQARRLAAPGEEAARLRGLPGREGRPPVGTAALHRFGKPFAPSPGLTPGLAGEAAAEMRARPVAESWEKIVQGERATAEEFGSAGRSLPSGGPAGAGGKVGPRVSEGAA